MRLRFRFRGFGADRTRRSPSVKRSIVSAGSSAGTSTTSLLREAFFSTFAVTPNRGEPIGETTTHDTVEGERAIAIDQLALVEAVCSSRLRNRWNRSTLTRVPLMARFRRLQKCSKPLVWPVAVKLRLGMVDHARVVGLKRDVRRIGVDGRASFGAGQRGIR